MSSALPAEIVESRVHDAREPYGIGFRRCDFPCGVELRVVVADARAMQQQVAAAQIGNQPQQPLFRFRGRDVDRTYFYPVRRRSPKCFEIFRAATCGPDLPAGGDIQFGDLQSDTGSGPEDDDSIRGDNR